MNNFFCLKVLSISVFLLISGISNTWAKTASSFKDSDKSNFDLPEMKKYEDIDISKILITPLDSVTYYTRGANGLIVMPPEDWDPFPYNVKFRDTVIYNPAFLPVIFDGKILPSNLDFRSLDRKTTPKKYHLIPKEESFAPLIERSDKIQKLRKNFYLNINNIQNVRYDVSTLKEIPKFDEEEVTKRNIWNELIMAEDPIKPSVVELPKIDPEYIYWIKNGEHKLQLTQNFASLNWHKGENRSFLVLNYHKFYLGYKKDKVTFDNTLEWKLNLQQTPADTLHDVNISDDLIRLENRFGYTAFNRWSYSAKLETQTQLFNTYPINRNEKNTAFLSPLIVNFGIGMNYSLEKKFESDKAKKLKLSLNLAPVSFNYTYLSDTLVTQRPGLDKGEYSKVEFGSTVNTDLAFSFNRYMSWTSRFKFFTNYEYAQMEFENKFDMALNRFLSTTVYLNLRFDNSEGAKKTKKPLNYFQLNEMVSFGLNYKW